MEQLTQAALSRHQLRAIKAETFPASGKVRASQIAAYLGLGVSTVWLYVKQGRIKPPQKYGVRLSVWDAEYIHQLYRGGIPAADSVEG